MVQGHSESCGEGEKFGGWRDLVGLGEWLGSGG